MSNLANQLQQQAMTPMDFSGVAKGTMEGVHAGMDLAERRQKIDYLKQQMAMHQQEMTAKTAQMMHDGLLEIAQTEDKPMKKALLSQLEQKMTALKQPPLDDSTRELVLKSPDFGRMLQTSSAAFQAVTSGHPEAMTKGQIEFLNQWGGKAGQWIKFIGDSIKTATMAKAQMTKVDQANSRIQMGKERIEEAFRKDIEKNPALQSAQGVEKNIDNAMAILNKPGGPNWIDFKESSLDFARILQGAGAIPMSREASVSFQSNLGTLQQAAGKVLGHEVGGPSPKELAIMKDRLERVKNETLNYHDEELNKLIQARSGNFQQLGQDPSELFEKYKRVPDREYSTTPIAQLRQARLQGHGIPTQQGPTGNQPAPGATPAPAQVSQPGAMQPDELVKHRALASDAITKGADPALVKRMFKDKTGLDLDVNQKMNPQAVASPPVKAQPIGQEEGSAQAPEIVPQSAPGGQ